MEIRFYPAEKAIRFNRKFTPYTPTAGAIREYLLRDGV